MSPVPSAESWSLVLTRLICPPKPPDTALVLVICGPGMGHGPRVPSWVSALCSGPGVPCGRQVAGTVWQGEGSGRAPGSLLGLGTMQEPARLGAVSSRSPPGQGCTCALLAWKRPQRAAPGPWAASSLQELPGPFPDTCQGHTPEKAGYWHALLLLHTHIEWAFKNGLPAKKHTDLRCAEVDAWQT